jgi:hypothetical protein
MSYNLKLETIKSVKELQAKKKEFKKEKSCSQRDNRHRRQRTKRNY